MNRARDGEQAVRHGVERTRCGCELCTVFCRFTPGRLDPDDLAGLCPEGRDLFAWAEEHLRAVPDVGEPRIVPVRNARGHCHWFLDGLCLVHQHAPFGCAFFDAHMPPNEVDRRAALASNAIRADAVAEGPYIRLWRHLRDRGLTTPSGDRAAVAAELRRLRTALERAGLNGDNARPPDGRPTWSEP